MLRYEIPRSSGIGSCSFRRPIKRRSNPFVVTLMESRLLSPPSPRNARLTSALGECSPRICRCFGAGNFRARARERESDFSKAPRRPSLLIISSFVFAFRRYRGRRIMGNLSCARSRANYRRLSAGNKRRMIVPSRGIVPSNRFRAATSFFHPSILSLAPGPSPSRGVERARIMRHQMTHRFATVRIFIREPM